ncbi:MAG: GRP family sugar transporter [Chitinophagaceae bacterium]
MFIIENYTLAIIFCTITMICWGSWANTQKLVTGKWRFELFYWDYVLGILLFSLLAAFTLGSTGENGRSFLVDIKQASGENIRSALIGGVVFNLANILLTAAIAIAGMAVAFPVGIGIALVLGVLINYISVQKGEPAMLFGGVILVAIAIVLNAVAFKRSRGNAQKAGAKGILLSVLAGVLMSCFYRFIAASMDLNNFVNPEPLKMTPYSASVVFAVGILISNLLFNTILMRKPIEGPPVSYRDYFSGKFSLHTVGILGGAIWGTGNLFNLIAAGKAGPAVSYGLGQGATLVAAIWGVLVWKEFKGSQKNVTGLLIGMFACFVIGLALIILSGSP